MSRIKSPVRLEPVRVDMLVPYAHNARTHPEKQLQEIQASIREFGFLNPVLIDGNYNVIAGHGRIEAARREGLETVPAIFIEHLTDEQRRAYILADNKLAEGGRWNLETLRLELTEITGIDLGLFGFTEMTVPEMVLEHIHEEEEFVDADTDPDKVKKRIADIVGKLPAAAVEKALCIVIPQDRGGAHDCLLFTDESCADIVAEIKRYADQGERSPLARLAAGLVNYE